MPVEYGDYDEDPELDEGAAVAQSGETWLISDTDLDADPVVLNEIDGQPGRVRIHTVSDADGIEFTDMEFETFQMARLAFGLWETCGPFAQPEGNAIPLEVATEGQAAIAAYLRVGNGYPNSREYVADKMGVTPQTVSNYCNQIRWSP
jgi:hypothetical protein